jgi:glycine/D-amino acid oxidase-like deaminating enzyme
VGDGHQHPAVGAQPTVLGRVRGSFRGRCPTAPDRAFDHDADVDWISAVLQQISGRFGIQIDRSPVIDSWAGLYPSTPDQHPIIDRTDAGMVIVGGFAGAGLMHRPAAGMVTAELVVDGQINSIDAATLSLARFSKPSESLERTGF